MVMLNFACLWNPNTHALAEKNNLICRAWGHHWRNVCYSLFWFISCEVITNLSLYFQGIFKVLYHNH